MMSACVRGKDSYPSMEDFFIGMRGSFPLTCLTLEHRTTFFDEERMDENGVWMDQAIILFSEGVF